MVTRHRSRLMTVFLIAIATLLAVPGTISAGPPVVTPIEDYAQFDVCGVTTDFSIQGRETLHIIDDVTSSDNANYLWFGQSRIQYTITYTSLETGHVLTDSGNRMFKDITVIDLGGGYWEAHYQETGISVWIQDGNQTLFKDVGRIEFTDVIYFGDLSTEADDQFISNTMDFMAGPHPIFFDDGSLFCAAYRSVMATTP
jgi:hypothetical protein